jgi:hypothetical protein
MPITDESLESLKGVLGDEHADLFTSIQTEATADRSTIDSLRGGHASLEQKLAEAVSSGTATAEELAQARKDLETASSDEALQRMTAERDLAIRTGNEHEANFKALTETVYNNKVKRSLQSALFKDVEATAAQKKKAMKDIMSEGVPEGLSFDGEGELVGHVELVKKYRKDNPFYFGATEGKPGNQGSSNGSDPKGKLKPEDKKKAAYERGKKAALDSMKAVSGLITTASA